MGKIKGKIKSLFNFKSNRDRTTWQIIGTIIVIAIIAVIVIVLLIGAGIKGWEYSNSNAFCANVCHKVHPEESVAIQGSKHSNVSCVECHGRVDQMEVVTQVKTLSMKFCLDCHRNPDARLRPIDEVTNLAWTAGDQAEEVGARIREELNINPKDNCSTCHR